MPRKKKVPDNVVQFPVKEKAEESQVSEEKYILTPKGLILSYFLAEAAKYNIDLPEEAAIKKAEEIMALLAGYAKKLTELDPDEGIQYPAIIFAKDTPYGTFISVGK